jgi:hypothetical protein
VLKLKSDVYRAQGESRSLKEALSEHREDKEAREEMRAARAEAEALRARLEEMTRWGEKKNTVMCCAVCTCRDHERKNKRQKEGMTR